MWRKQTYQAIESMPITLVFHHQCVVVGYSTRNVLAHDLFCQSLLILPHQIIIEVDNLTAIFLLCLVLIVYEDSLYLQLQII